MSSSSDNEEDDFEEILGNQQYDEHDYDYADQEAAGGNTFLQRNTQLYGSKTGKWVTHLLKSKLGVRTKNDFAQTQYRDALQLALDVASSVIVSRNDQGQVLDCFHKPVCNLGNNIYAGLDSQNRTLYFFVNDNGTQRLVNAAGDLLHHKQNQAAAVGSRIGQENPSSTHSAPENTAEEEERVDADEESGRTKSEDQDPDQDQRHQRKSRPRSSPQQHQPQKHQPQKHPHQQPQKQHHQQQLSSQLLRCDANHFRGMFSDKRLTTHVQLIHRDYIRQGIHLYRYQWNQKARELFNLVGVEYGLMMSEIKLHYPNVVHPCHHDPHQHHPLGSFEYICIDANRAKDHTQLQKIAYMMQNKTLFNRAVHYLLQPISSSNSDTKHQAAETVGRKKSSANTTRKKLV